MEQIDKSYKIYKFSSSCQEDIYNIIKLKSKEFLENVHSKAVSDRFFLKNHSDLLKICLDEVKSTVFNKVLFYKNYKNKNIEALNDEDNIAFLDFEENRIFIEFNEMTYNFSNIENDEKLVQLDLIGGQTAMEDNENLSQEEVNQNNENLSLTVPGSNDLICVNNFPISISHTNLVLNHDKCFAQLLSNELINQALEFFNLTQNNTLRIGFDSLGAGCIINHLHFECIWLEDFKIDKLAIETVKSNKLFDTNLIHLNKEENEINLVRLFYIFI